jgi:SAM-dependent methyltransferase
LKNLIVSVFPDPLVKGLVRIRNRLRSKGKHELDFWKSRFEIDNGVFVNMHFEKFMLGMAQEEDDGFLKDKIVADFGCGPRGSLVWIKSARVKIGIDVLADSYVTEFAENIKSHDMIYLKSTEEVIPLPSDFVDVMFTINAMDHVSNLPVMCKEVIRVIRPGGYLIGSFKLGEPETTTEPQTLSEDIIKKHLLDYMDVDSYRVTAPGPGSNQYQPFFDNELSYNKGESSILWVKARKQTNK